MKRRSLIQSAVAAITGFFASSKANAVQHYVGLSPLPDGHLTELLAPGELQVEFKTDRERFLSGEMGDDESAAYQAWRWVMGEDLHNPVRDECAPCGGCCTTTVVHSRQAGKTLYQNPHRRLAFVREHECETMKYWFERFFDSQAFAALSMTSGYADSVDYYRGILDQIDNMIDGRPTESVIHADLPDRLREYVASKKRDHTAEAIGWASADFCHNHYQNVAPIEVDLADYLNRAFKDLDCGPVGEIEYRKTLRSHVDPDFLRINGKNAV